MKKVSIITGGSQGIGKAITERLSKDGVFVIIVDINKKEGGKLEKKLSREKSRFIYCDITDEKEVKELFNTIKKDYSKIDVLVNNAGITKDNVIWKMSSDDFDSVIKVNLKGSWLMCREAAILMREQKKGRIVNISSRGWLGNFGQTNYGASKGGIVSLTRVLALELAKYNILVNTVAPGMIDTPMTQGLSEDERKKLTQSQPIKMLGKPEHIAHVVSFLSSEKTEFITGQIIYVDGGKNIGAGI